MNNLNEIRDDLQKIFLRNLFQQKTDNLIALKGGVAIHFERQERYTKDIDLQVHSIMSLDRLKRIINKSLKDCQLDKVLTHIKITIPKETETVVRWKINGIMNNSENFNMTIEISRRDYPNKDDLENIEYYLNNFSVVVNTYSINALILSKIECLNSEFRTEPRDLYDLFYLFKEKKYDLEQIVQKINDLGINLNQMMDNIELKINLIDFKLFESNLKPYLNKQKQKYFNEERWDDLRLNILDNILTIKKHQKNERNKP